jgi:aminoglycoside phosphotransferase (APT) family kinase protein
MTSEGDIDMCDTKCPPATQLTCVQDERNRDADGLQDSVVQKGGCMIDAVHGKRMSLSDTRAELPDPGATMELHTDSMLLTCIHREMSATLLPELHSDRAKNTAAMMSRLLRHLILKGEDVRGGHGKYLERARELASKIACGYPGPDSAGTPLQEAEQSDFSDLIDKAVAAMFGQHRKIRSSDGISPSTLMRVELDYIARDAFEADSPNGGATSGAARRDFVTPKRLTAYLQGRYREKDLKVVSVKSTPGGVSKDVFIVEFEKLGHRERIVIRGDRPNGPIETPVVAEHDLLKALQGQVGPIPESLWVEEDKEILGFPFLAMRWVAGRPLAASFSMPANEDTLNGCLWLAEFLARLHKLDVVKLPVPLGDGSMSAADNVRHYIASWERLWRSRRTETSIILTTAFTWLMNNIPQDGQRPVLVHGDAGFHNVMSNDGRVTAMLDWECAHVGHPAEDLAFCRLWVEGVMNWDDFLGRYKESGGDTKDQFRFFTIMYLARNAVISAAMWAEFITGTQRDVKASYAGIYLYRFFLGKIADELALAGC